MNEAPQFDPHPDADQISAFVEHALPAHEQVQMLGHLSICPECRAIVALSLPPSPDPARSVVAPSRLSWSSGWALAWPTAAAIAALLIFLVTVHRAIVVPNTAAPGQNAASHLPPPLAPGQAPAISGQQSLAAQPNDGRRGTPRSKPPRSTQQIANDAITPNLASSVPIKGRHVTALDSVAQPAPESPEQAASPSASADGGTVGALVRPSGNGAGASYGAGASIVGAPEDQLKAAAAAPPRPALAPQFPGQTSQTVAVASDARSLQTETSDNGNLTIAQSPAEIAPLKHRLPSKLPVLSMAADGLRLVAIDTRNAVFASKDGGRHWKAVHPQWTGRAVAAVLVSFPIVNAARKLSNPARFAPAPQPSPAALATENAPPIFALPQQSTPGRSLTGTVTDPSGAVVPGATVTVRDPLKHASHAAITDRAGHYQIEGLTAGNYQLQAQASGFKQQTLTAIAIEPKGPNVANVTLDVGTASETVEVTSAADAIETTHGPLPDQVMSGISKKKLAGPAAPVATPGLFEITTDNGDKWTSVDGKTWNRK